MENAASDIYGFTISPLVSIVQKGKGAVWDRPESLRKLATLVVSFVYFGFELEYKTP